MKRPDEIGGAEAEIVHVILEDAGITLLEATVVEIIIDLEDQDYGGRGNSYPAAIFVHFSGRRVILNVPVQQARPLRRERVRRSA